jgi:hypothetical protein
MICPPTEPHDSLAPFTPAGERTLRVFGALATLLLVPSRSQRAGAAAPDRPAFARARAERIVGEEAYWRGGGLALTPNRYPFAAGQRILWPESPLREPDEALWAAACTWADAAGSALVNTIGAAATIGRAHVHLVPGTLPFLSSLHTRPAPQNLIDLPAGAELLAADVPFCLLGVRGSPAARATALVRLCEARLCAAWNVVVQDGVAWVYPRSTETPAPFFPFALGAAEISGRWCYVDEAPFAAATANDLERALETAGMAPLP